MASTSAATAKAARRTVAALCSRVGRRTFSDVPVVPMLLDGQRVQSKSTKLFDVHNPATGELIARTPQCTPEELRLAADSCAEAFKSWRTVPPSSRARVMHKYEGAIRDRTEELAQVLTLEQGKTIADAKGDIFRGLEVVEMSTSVPAMMQGETLAGVAHSVDVHSYRVPLGVVGGICPFNFPAMIPLWMYPPAVTAGNACV